MDLLDLEREAGLSARLTPSAGGRRYAVKALWRTVQGEGAQAGRPAVFVRLAGCNLWSGLEADRARDAARHGNACALWCFSPETPVLMDDYTTRPIGQVQIGERVLGAEIRGGHVRLASTVVRNTHRRTAPLARLEFDNGTLVGTADHSVLVRPETSRERTGYRKALEAVGRRTFSLLGSEPARFVRNAEFWRGWLAGIAFGDGCFWTLKKRTRVRSVPYDRRSAWTTRATEYRRFRLAMLDGEVLDRFRREAETQGFNGWYEGVHHGTGHSAYVMRALYLTRSKPASRFETYLAPVPGASRDYKRGFVAGFIDAEGHVRDRSVTVFQSRTANPGLCDVFDGYLADLGIRHAVEPGRWVIHGQESLKMLAMCPPVLVRKTRTFEGRSLNRCHGRLESVEDVGLEGTVVALTTESGNFVAGGHVVKNCDTDFAPAGAVKLSAGDLADAVLEAAGPVRFCVLTGGEPLLQADGALVQALHDRGFWVAVETNGTVALEDAFGDGPRPDWVVCSPKLPHDRLALEACDELKLVVPDYRPDAYRALQAAVRVQPDGRRYLWLQPEDGPRLAEATRLALDLCFDDPAWRVSVQTHKALGVD